ncbi:MAG: PAS domain-containing protein [Chloroflexaceae bacterium]|nr:PAS domain-containing protein [Chloroflexaceae bacterium]
MMLPPVGAVELSTCITDHHRLHVENARLQDRIRRLETLLATTQDVTFILDTNGVIVHIPSANPDLLPRPVAALLNVPLHTVLPAEQADAFVMTVRQVLETDTSLRLEYAMHVPAGERWFSATVSPLQDHTAIMVAHDVTEHVVARQELRAQVQQVTHTQQLLEQILDTIPIAVNVRDLQGNYLFINSAFEALLGQPREMIIGQNDMRWVPAEIIAETRQSDQHIIETGQTVDTPELIATVQDTFATYRTCNVSHP